MSHPSVTWSAYEAQLDDWANKLNAAGDKDMYAATELSDEDLVEVQADARPKRVKILTVILTALKITKKRLQRLVSTI